MVTRALLFLLCFPFFLLALDPVVEISMEESNVEEQPLKGLITITHDSSDQADLDSFKSGEQTLSVKLLQEVPMTAGSQNTIVSIYSFSLDPKPKGLYILPALKVKVGKQTVQTLPIAYEVRSLEKKSSLISPSSQGARKISNRPKSFVKPASIIFRLEAGIEGPKILYPGQRAKLFYRISYNRNIDLTNSYLPFVHASQFKKVGDARINDFQLDRTTVQEIIQEVVAAQTGKFNLGPSYISGYAYQLDELGNKIYISSLLEAQAPALGLEVRPFPLENQPFSFNGALGNIHAEIKMTSPPKRNLGDKIDLELSLSNVENLEEVKFPDFFCQSGFSGFFRSNDPSPAGEIKEGVKRFAIGLTAISKFIRQVPSFEISSFDPATGQYVIVHTSPIPLEIIVKQMAEAPPQTDLASSTHLNEEIIWNPASWPLAPLEIRGSLVSSQDLYLPWLQTFWTLLIIPFGLAWLFFQVWWHRNWANRPSPSVKQSEKFFEQALRSKSLPAAQVVHLVETAYWWKVWEEGVLAQKGADLEDLPAEGSWGEVRRFILYLQTLQYSPEQKISVPEVIRRAQLLWRASPSFNNGQNNGIGKKAG
jgi:hypothetical protein